MPDQDRPPEPASATGPHPAGPTSQTTGHPHDDGHAATDQARPGPATTAAERARRLRDRADVLIQRANTLMARTDTLLERADSRLTAPRRHTP